LEKRVRAEFRFAPYRNLNGLKRLTVGMGVKLNRFELDYSLTTLGDLASTNQFPIFSVLTF
jgi:hypothetical protein